MPAQTKTESSNSGTGRVSRSMAANKRRGRSRSPSAYLKKKGKSLKGFFKSGTSGMNATERRRSAGKFLLESAMQLSPSKLNLAKMGEEEGQSDPPSVIMAKNTKDDEESVYGIEAVGLDFEDDKTASSDDKTKETATKEATSESKDKIEPDPSTPVEKKSDTEVLDLDQTAEQKPVGDSPETVRIVLLLMDPDSRRFELLQLEFDPVKAIVEDLLSQIPSAATEETVRMQKYDSICSIHGEEMTCTNRLRDFVEGQPDGIQSVVLAVPQGFTSSECAAMAAPILSDRNVASMVNPSMPNEKIETVAPPAPTPNPADVAPTQSFEEKKEEPPAPAPKKEKKVTPAPAPKEEKKVTPAPAPKEENKKVTPAPAPKEEKKKTPAPTPKEEKKTVAPVVEKKPTPKKEKEVTPAPTPKEEKKVTPAPAAVEKPAVKPRVAGGIESKQLFPSSSLSTIPGIIIFLVLLSPLFHVFHTTISAPLSPGDVLAPGTWRSHCGLIPPVAGCESKALHFDNEGTLLLYKVDSVVVRATINDARKCSDGCELSIGEDGAIMIGGEMAVFDTPPELSDLSPWPFAAEIPLAGNGKKQKRRLFGGRKD